MNYSEKEMAKLISEVETEFKDYLTKSEPVEEVSEEIENVEEELVAKSENEFDYDDEDINEMNKMYSSMSKAEAEAHYKSLKSVVFTDDMNKSEETEEVEVVENNEETELLKTEVESVKIDLETSKKENDELKKNLETLTGIISKVVKSAPKRKAVTQIGDIQYIKKSEETVETVETEVDYSKMSKKEINKILSTKIRNGEIKKSEDRENINKYCHSDLKFDDIKYLL